MFRCKLGTEFQDFFCNIMARAYPQDFQIVKPYGNVGDKKCDGYHRSLRRVYQVYAPEKMQAAETTNKIEKDFDGAVRHWKNDMIAWVFVHNQWRGVPADVLQTLLSLDNKNDVKVLTWCEVELRNEFFRLSDEQQAFLLGPAPTLQSFARIQLRFA
jgi:hypothetical protein